MMGLRFCDHAIFFVITNVEYSAAARQMVGNLGDTADNRAIKITDSRRIAAFQCKAAPAAKRMTDGRSEIQQPTPR
jgi:hypothetical protein